MNHICKSLLLCPPRPMSFQGLHSCSTRISACNQRLVSVLEIRYGKVSDTKLLLHEAVCEDDNDAPSITQRFTVFENKTPARVLTKNCTRNCCCLGMEIHMLDSELAHRTAISLMRPSGTFCTAASYTGRVLVTPKNSVALLIYMMYKS